MAPTPAFSELLELKTTNAEALRFLGESAYFWFYLGERDKARAIFEALVLLAPNDPVGHLGLAEVWLGQGKFREAERSAQQAARVANIARATLAFAHILRGHALLGLGRPKDAEKAFLQAQKLDPEGPQGQDAVVRLEIARLAGGGRVVTPEVSNGSDSKKK